MTWQNSKLNYIYNNQQILTIQIEHLKKKSIVLTDLLAPRTNNVTVPMCVSLKFMKKKEILIFFFNIRYIKLNNFDNYISCLSFI